jgi:hypothetical protein
MYNYFSKLTKSYPYNLNGKLKKVYLPVFGRNNLLTSFVPVLNDITAQIITRKFRDLLKELNKRDKDEILN